MQPIPPGHTVRLVPRRPGRRRRLRLMLGGSVAVHLLALLALWWFQPPDEQAPASAVNEVAMVFESPGGAQASTPSQTPAQTPTVAQGNPNSTNTQPSPETTAPSNSPPPDPAPPTPAPPTPTPPAQVASLEQAPPQPEPPATPEQPQPVQPPAEQPQPIPTPSQEPPSVYLRDDSEPAFRPLPRFVMPQPPAPLPAAPPAPRPAPPRRVARPSPQNPFAAPQDWSLNAGPASPTPSRSARGFDLSPSPMGSQSNSNFSYVAGARPTGDWLSAFRRWAQARVYYPEEAAREGQDGVATVMVEVERSGHVRSVRLENSARSPFLDGALVDLFRNATVPPVTSDMPDPVTMMRVQLTYHLIRR